MGDRQSGRPGAPRACRGRVRPGGARPAIAAPGMATPDLPARPDGGLAVAEPCCGSRPMCGGSARHGCATCRTGSTWAASPARRRVSPWPGDGPIIGTVAALRAEKNLARLLRAFHLAVQDTPGRLVVIGDGPERAALEALASKLGVADRVFWAGHVPDPAELIKAFDIFAMSSDTEQMPISLLEAMAAGLPTAATDVGDIKQMLPLRSRALRHASRRRGLGCGAAPPSSGTRAPQELSGRRAGPRRSVISISTMFDAWEELLAGNRTATRV